MNPIGKINNCGVFAQAHYIAFRGKYKNLFIKQVFFDRSQVVVVVSIASFLLPLHQLTKPIKPLLISGRWGSTFFVLPMSCNAEFRYTMHPWSANLNLNGSMPADDRSM